MTLLSPARVLQPTTTTGTGAYALSATGSQFRNFRDQYPTLAFVPYVATDTTTAYEIGVGQLIYGTPDTINRSIIIASSNANLAVSWPTGTRIVHSFETGESTYVSSFNTNLSLDLSAWGTTFAFVGSSPGVIAALPAIAQVPIGYVVGFRNSGSVPFTIAPHGSEAIEGMSASTALTVQPGMIAELSSDLTVWRLVNSNFGAYLNPSSFTANHTVQAWENGTIFDNVGSSGTVNFTLPTAVRGLSFGFTVAAAHTLTVTAPASVSIAIGASNSATGGTISASAIYAHCSIYAVSTTQWVSRHHEGTWTVT